MVPGPSPSASRRSLAPIGLSIAAVLVLASLVASVWVHGEPLRPSPIAAYDFGPLPAPEENGMQPITDAPPGLFESAWPSEDLLHREGPPSLEALESLRADLEAWTVSDDARARIEEALARPHIAFDCPLDPRVPCEVLPWHHAHRSAVTLTLRDAVMGFDDDALARAERLLIADREVLVTSRTMLQLSVAVRNAAIAIEVAGVLGTLVASRDRDAISNDAASSIERIEEALIALDPASWSAERAVRGEVVQNDLVIDMLAPDGRARWGLGAAVERIDRYHLEMLAHARDPDHTPPPLLPDPDDFSRTFQPYAVLAVSPMFDLAPFVRRVHEGAQRAVERAEVVRVTLAAARARAMTTSAPDE